MRVERQTLRKMPGSGDILFTIRIYLDPLKAILSQPDAARLSAALAQQLEAMTPLQIGYKGLQARRADLVALLRNSAANQGRGE